MTSKLLKEIIKGRLYFKMGTGYGIIEVGVIRETLYLIEDGIYTDWTMFAKKLHRPTKEEE